MTAYQRRYVGGAWLDTSVPPDWSEKVNDLGYWDDIWGQHDLEYVLMVLISYDWEIFEVYHPSGQFTANLLFLPCIRLCPDQEAVLFIVVKHDEGGISDTKTETEKEVPRGLYTPGSTPKSSNLL